MSIENITLFSELHAEPSWLQDLRKKAFDKIDQFTRENEAFRENPLVSDFLAAELAFCRMMQEIGLYVTDQMRFE